MGLAAFAAVGLFGGGLAVNGSDSCGLRWILRKNQDASKANAENVRRLGDFQNPPPDYVRNIKLTRMESFF